ncbi:MAG: phosphopantetheine-binding protein, partial [Pseudomonadota bacterium]|nr:phosphopantetheine-binding protein [Pseudomonadota bacterium]
DKPQIIDIVKKILAEDLDLNISYEQIGDEASFLEDGLALDSISMAEFIDHVERRFSIRILDEDLDTATFKSLGSVVSLIQKRSADCRPVAGAL